MMTKQKCYSPFCNMSSFPAFVYHDCTKTWVRRKPRLDRGTQGLPKELLCVEREWESGNVGCLSNTCKKSSPFSSVSVIQPHRQQHFRLPCPSPTPRHAQTHVHRVDDAIQGDVVTFSSCFQSFPASGSFSMSQFFASGRQSIGGSASASIPPMNIQDWFPLGLTGWVSLQSKGLSRVFSNTTVHKHQFFGTQLPL